MNGELLIEKRGRTLLLTIRNPSARNSLGPAIWRSGLEAISQGAVDAAIGAIVLTGADGQFCSGGNLGRMKENRGKPRSCAHEGITQLHDWIWAIRTCPKPVIAAVEGSAAGAGFSLALACDLIVAAEDARFVASHVKVGISPDGGISTSLARGLPPQMLTELLLEGGVISAECLKRFGIVNRLCSTGAALDTALAWADRLSAGPPQAMGRIKQLIEAAYHNTMPSQLSLEQQLVMEGIFHEECGEGIAAFFAKRPPVFVQGGSR